MLIHIGISVVLILLIIGDLLDIFILNLIGYIGLAITLTLTILMGIRHWRDAIKKTKSKKTKKEISKIQMSRTDIGFWVIVVGLVAFSLIALFGITILGTPDTFWGWMIFAIIGYIAFIILAYIFIIRKGWGKKEEVKKVQKLGNVQIIELKLNIAGIVILLLLGITGIIVFLGFLARLYGLFTEKEILLFYVVVLLLLTVIIVLVIRTRSKSKSKF